MKMSSKTYTCPFIVKEVTELELEAAKLCRVCEELSSRFLEFNGAVYLNELRALEKKNAKICGLYTGCEVDLDSIHFFVNDIKTKLQSSDKENIAMARDSLNTLISTYNRSVDLDLNYDMPEKMDLLLDSSSKDWSEEYVNGVLESVQKIVDFVDERCKPYEEAIEEHNRKLDEWHSYNKALKELHECFGKYEEKRPYWDWVEEIYAQQSQKTSLTESPIEQDKN